MKSCTELRYSPQQLLITLEESFDSFNRKYVYLKCSRRRDIPKKRYSVNICILYTSFRFRWQSLCRLGHKRWRDSMVHDILAQRPRNLPTCSGMKEKRKDELTVYLHKYNFIYFNKVTPIRFQLK